MNLNEIAALVGELTDQQLQQEINQPSGVAPLNILASEAQRRLMMRREGYADGGFVGSQYVQGINPIANILAAYGNEQLRDMAGASGPRRSLHEIWSGDELSQMLPDRTGVFAEQVGALEQEAEKAKRGNRGRALMEMGLAMMASKDPSFFGALGAGGMAGLSARDRIKAQERGLMKDVMQAKMGQAQVQSQRDAQMMNAATSLYGQQENRWNALANIAGNAGSATTGIQTTGAQMAHSQRLQDDAQAHAMAIAQMQEAGANRRAAMAAGRTGPGSPLKLEDAMQLQKQWQEKIYSTYYDKDGKETPYAKSLKAKGLRPPTRQEIEVQATASAGMDAFKMGVMPPSAWLSDMQKVYGAGGMRELMERAGGGGGRPATPPVTRAPSADDKPIPLDQLAAGAGYRVAPTPKKGETPTKGNATQRRQAAARDTLDDEDLARARIMGLGNTMSPFYRMP